MALLSKCSKAVPISTRSRRATILCRAQAVDRRALLGALTAAPLLASVPPSFAAYGETANIFGQRTNKSGYITYISDDKDFALALPPRWNPSRERDFPGVVLRYEDNAAAANNVMVIKQTTDKSSIQDYGSPEEFLNKFSYLLGQQSFDGETYSEGGFAPGRVAAASILEIDEVSDKRGKTYYQMEVLTRSADGDEGGRHQLIKATVSGSTLYILKVQAGDKRWFKGAKKDCLALQDSFTVV